MSNDKLREGLKALDEMSPFAAAVREIERLNAALGQVTLQNGRLRTLLTQVQRTKSAQTEQIRQMSIKAQVMLGENMRLKREKEALTNQRDEMLKRLKIPTETKKPVSDAADFFHQLGELLNSQPNPTWR